MNHAFALSLGLAIVVGGCGKEGDLSPGGSGSGGTAGQGGAGESGAGDGGSKGGGLGGNAASLAWWGHEDGDCTSVGEPSMTDRPAGTSDEAIEPFVVALTSFRFGSRNGDGEPDSEAWRDIGFDLDHTCTSSVTCGTYMEQPLVTSCMSNVPREDAQECRDNMFGARIDPLETSMGAMYRFNEPGVTCALNHAGFSMLFKVSEFNGRANDDQVRVDFYPSPGVVGAEALFAEPCDPIEPFDGHSWTASSKFRFRVDESYLTDAASSGELPPSPRFDDKAFVRDGFLVMQIPEGMTFWFPHDLSAPVYSLPLRFHSAIAVARLTFSDADPASPWALTEGTIGGKLYESEVPDAFEKLGLCDPDPLYSLVHELAVGGLDVRTTSANDPSAACDAMSFGVAFTAKQALVGDAVHVEPLVKCDGTTDPM